MAEIILASQSQARKAMLDAAEVPYCAKAAHIDEESLRDGLLAEGVSARNIADALAEAKALKISRAEPGALVLGSDQILECADGSLLAKAQTPDEARATLARLSGTTHRLWSAAVMAQQGRSIWRHVEKVDMTMRVLSDEFVDHYVDKHWDNIRHCVGCYAAEGAGIQLFSQIKGNWHCILGMPLLAVLDYLRVREIIGA